MVEQAEADSSKDESFQVVKIVIPTFAGWIWTFLNLNLKKLI